MGRPTKYDPDYAEQAYQHCLAGATDAVLAEAFGISESTLNEWKNRYPEFRASVAMGKAPADAQVAYAVFRKATGYERNGVWYPPDTHAGIFWLKNRRPDRWRDKIDADQNVAVTLNFRRDPELWAAIEYEVSPSLASKVEALPEQAKETMRLVLKDVPVEQQGEVYDRAIVTVLAAANRGESEVPVRDLIERQAPDVSEAAQGYGANLDLDEHEEEERQNLQDASARVEQHNRQLRERMRRG
jgi:hypothetical protein